MTKLILRVSFLFGFFIFLSLPGSVNFKSSALHESQQVKTAQTSSKNLNTSPDYGRISLYFVPNEGQVDERALFYAKTSKYTLWLTKEGLIFDSTRRIKKESTKSIRQNPRNKKNPEEFTFDRDVSSMVFVNANRSPKVIPMDDTEHKVNYFIGNDESKWPTNIQTSRTVLYKELYPNIDLKVYGIEKQIEYDFIVKSGGDVSDIIFEYKDIESTNIDREGNLIIVTKFGKIMQKKPVCYQVIEGKRIEVEAEFGKIEMNTYSFEVEEYNGDYELIIDPLVLAYSTYLGGSDSDYAYGIAVDSEGAAYITGYTYSSDFPTENPMQGSFPVSSDVFISKINPAGSALIYSTYLGGSDSDYACGIAVDSEGAAYITGYTYSTDFPTKNPMQGDCAGYSDVFIGKINPAGSVLIYSSYLGGSAREMGYGIAIDVEGAVYVTGSTASYDFPTVNPIQEWPEDGFYNIFVSKINPLGSALVYSTYLGYELDDYGQAIAVDSEGAAYVTGCFVRGDYPWGDPSNVFVLKINPSGGVLDYLDEWGEGYRYRVAGGGIAVDAEGAAYATWTSYYLEEWPNVDTDAYVSKINVDGDNRIYTINLGGTGDDWTTGIAIDLKGAAYVTGGTDSDDFPIKNPIQEKRAGNNDGFIVKVNPAGTKFEYSTYLGGAEYDFGSGIAVDSEDSAYVTGRTDSIDFPKRNPIQPRNAGGRDVLITKLWTTFVLAVAAGAGGTTDPPPGNYDYYAGSEAVIKAIPDEGYGFSHWSRDATGTDNPITIIMDSDKSIKANFIRQYSLTINSGIGGTTDPSPGTYLYNRGTKVTLTAIPDTHYRFSHWSGDIGGRDNPKIKTMNKDLSITANFIRIIYPPSDFSGQKVLNRSLSQAEYINVLTWQSNANNENIRNYRIYQVEGESWSLLVEVNASVFEYWHRGVEETTSYTYAIVAVNDESREGDPAYITVQ